MKAILATAIAIVRHGQKYLQKSATASAAFLALSGAVGLLTLGVVSSAHAASDPSVWVGGALGMSVPNASNTTARPLYGITAGAKVGSEFGVGAYYLTSTKDETSGTVTVPFAYDLYGVEGAYYFEGEAKGVYLGGRLGMSRVSSKNPLSGTTYAINPMHWGLMAGYNYMIGDHFSLGGEAGYMSIASGNTTVGGTAYSIDAFSTLNFLLTAKFWF